MSREELVLAWLFGTEPTDRALAGWSPLFGVQQTYSQFMREHGIDPGWPWESVPVWPPVS